MSPANQTAAVSRPARSRSLLPPAESFQRSRRDRAGEIAQDYVEAIADLTQSRAKRAWWIWRGGWA